MWAFAFFDFESLKAERETAAGVNSHRHIRQWYTIMVAGGGGGPYTDVVTLFCDIFAMELSVSVVSIHA